MDFFQINVGCQNNNLLSMETKQEGMKKDFFLKNSDLSRMELTEPVIIADL